VSYLRLSTRLQLYSFAHRRAVCTKSRAMGNGPEVVLRAVTEVMARAQSYGYLTAPWQGITHPVGLDTYTGGYRSLRRLGLRPEKLMPKSRQSKAAELEGVALNQLINCGRGGKGFCFAYRGVFSGKGSPCQSGRNHFLFFCNLRRRAGIATELFGTGPSKSALQETLYFRLYLS
jgi:hypothetical protein